MPGTAHLHATNINATNKSIQQDTNTKKNTTESAPDTGRCKFSASTALWPPLLPRVYRLPQYHSTALGSMAVGRAYV